MFAAGLFAKGVHEFREYFEFEGAWYSNTVWNITNGPAGGGWVHDFMEGLFGWSPHSERVRVVAYVCLRCADAVAVLPRSTDPARQPIRAGTGLASEDIGVATAGAASYDSVDRDQLDADAPAGALLGRLGRTPATSSPSQRKHSPAGQRSSGRTPDLYHALAYW